MTHLSSFSEQYWSSPLGDEMQKRTARSSHVHEHTPLSKHSDTVWAHSQSACLSMTDTRQWAGTEGSEARRLFPAIIKQFNWICSYAGGLLVWISISMPSHKSYFQVHWALSSAKLILHDMPWGLALCLLYTEDILTDTSAQVPATVTHATCSLQAYMLQFTTQSWNTDN